MSLPDSPRRSRPAWLRRGIPLVAGLVLAVVVLLVVVTRVGGSGTDSAAASSTGPSVSADPGEGPATVSAPPTPITQAPASSVAVRQGTAGSARTVSGATAPFAAPASWGDGASVRVTRAPQQVSTGQGPGALVGQPQTVFTLELENGSSAPLDVNSVVVQATYGRGRAQASPLYDDRSQDFGGTVAPGGTATAVYSFVIPADQLGDVVLTVDVDGRHSPVAFSGAVTTS